MEEEGSRHHSSALFGTITTVWKAQTSSPCKVHPALAKLQFKVEIQFIAGSLQKVVVELMGDSFFVEVGLWVLGGKNYMESGSVNCWREVTQEGVQGCGEFPCILPPANVSLLMRSPSITGFPCRVERLEMRQQLHKRPKCKTKPLGSCAYSTCCAPCDSS